MHGFDDKRKNVVCICSKNVHANEISDPPNKLNNFFTYEQVDVKNSNTKDCDDEANKKN